jgi:hypothetical protein
MRMSGGLRQAKAAVCLWRRVEQSGSSAHNVKVTGSNPVPATIYLSRQSPDERRLKTPLRLFVVIGKLGPPRTCLRKVKGRSEAEPNAEFAEFSVIKTHLPWFFDGLRDTERVTLSMQTAGGRSSEISHRNSANKVLGMATSAIWNAAPILINFSWRLSATNP